MRSLPGRKMMDPVQPAQWLDYSNLAFLSKARELAFAGVPFEFDVPGDAGREIIRLVEQGDLHRRWIGFLTQRDLRFFAGAYQLAQIAQRTVSYQPTDNGVRVSIGGGPKSVASSREEGLD